LCLFLFGSQALFAQPSYWFSQWERKPDAAQAQAFFILPGLGIYFTYTNNRVVVNSTGGGPGGGGLTTNFCVLFCDSSQHTLWFTNGVLYAIDLHLPAIILPGGAGFLIQPGGGHLLIP